MEESCSSIVSPAPTATPLRVDILAVSQAVPRCNSVIIGNSPTREVPHLFKGTRAHNHNSTAISCNRALEVETFAPRFLIPR